MSQRIENELFYDGPPRDEVRVEVPATMGNVGAGFDVLGLALAWYSEVGLRRRERGLRVINEGEGASQLPTDQSHLVFRAVKRLFAAAGQPLPGLEIRVRNRLPLARGLGSSAAAVVAGLAAGAVLCGGSWRRSDLYRLAVPLEGHPDNVAPAIFGGLTISGSGSSGGGGEELPPPVVLPALTELRLVLVVPDLQLPTAEARRLLPAEVAHGDAVANVAAASLTVAAFATGRPELLAHGLSDRLHEPYRARLIPGFDAVTAAARAGGALGSVLSGAGPSIAAFFPGDTAGERLTQAGEAMAAAFQAAGCSARARLLRPSARGVARQD